jgi:uncharacterized protein with FMN-binding domain
MKKVLKWVGIVFSLLVVIISISAFLGKEQTLELRIHPVDLADIPDGDYPGEYSCYRWSNDVMVSVENHVITGIETVKGPDGRERIRQDLTARIMIAQSPAVDAVSGATADSKAFLKAVENALQND